jgi:hypothetical protein
MSHDESPERRGHGDFAEGEDDPAAFPQDEQVGNFAEGQEDEPHELQHQGRFSEGQEELGEDDPEKHVEGRFSTGEDEEPPNVVP